MNIHHHVTIVVEVILSERSVKGDHCAMFEKQLTDIFGWKTNCHLNPYDDYSQISQRKRRWKRVY